jgi:hypothetical protein
MRPLRPARMLIGMAEQRIPLVRSLALPARLVDHVLARAPKTHLRPARPTTRGMPLDAATMAAALPGIARERRLLPSYEPESLSWYLLRAQAVPGEVARVLVRDAKGTLLGWYIYHRGGDGTAQLLQLAAPAESAGRVLDHLLDDAWRSDMTVLRGRMDPALAQVYGERHCLFTRRGPWMVVHSREPALMHMFHRGEVLFSSLDGEYSVRFRPRAN